MPPWFPGVAQMVLATGATVFGITLLFTAKKTRLTYALALSALVAGWLTFVHYFHVRIPGWPAFSFGVFIWINTYSIYKHRMALSESILQKHRERRRSDD